MFVWKASTFLDCLKSFLPASHEGLTEIARAWDTPDRHAVLHRVYPELPKKSVDYAIMNRGSADRYGQADKYDQSGRPKQKFVPEGVEGLVPYRGPLAEFVYQLVGGLRAAMGYTGCPTIEDFKRDARFCRVTAASMVESHPHDIRITKESPNYTIEGRGEKH